MIKFQNTTSDEEWSQMASWSQTTSLPLSHLAVKLLTNITNDTWPPIDRKLCCSLANKAFKDICRIILSLIMDSKTLYTANVKLIGVFLPSWLRSPFLKIGIILATFQSVGRQLSSKDLENIRHKSKLPLK